jgi:hypothetical protein
LLVVPQFEDMINAPETRISVPPEPIANQIVQDPIFGHLSTMWNNIETSEELSLRHHTNQAALVQGAASVGIPIDVMRKTMERVADQYGEDLANQIDRAAAATRVHDDERVRPAAPAPRGGRRKRGHRTDDCGRQHGHRTDDCGREHGH